MRSAAEIIFWICLYTIIYTYAGYPLIVFLLVRIKNLFSSRRITQEDASPAVTLIVAAYNEERVIRKKIENSLALNYPSPLLNLVFVTDGSTDGTVEIIKQYDGVTLLHEASRKGKLDAVNRAVAMVKTPVIVFSDANTFLNRDSIANIVRHYADPAVGGVAGEKRIAARASGAVEKGEGLYWRYESLLKKLDSELRTTVGAAGELFSIRTELYTPLPANTIIEDFVQSLCVCIRGWVVRYEPEAYAEEASSLSLKDEMERKIRISAGGFQAMKMLKKLFNLFRFPVTSFEFISHRVLRWTLCPLFLALLFPVSLYLCLTRGSAFYYIAFGMQFILYMSAAAGWWLATKNIRPRVLYVPFYFVFMNFCVFAGFFRFVRNRQTAVWQRAQR